MCRQYLFLLLLLTLLHGSISLRILLLADTQLAPGDTYIDKELVPILQDINFDFFLFTGGFVQNPTSSDLSSQLLTLFQKFSSLGKKIYWVPSQDEIGAPPNVTNFDQNIHNMVIQPKSGLYILGYGGNYTSTEFQNFYQSQTFPSGSVVIFLTYEGPAGNGFDTTKIRIYTFNDGTTGISNMTGFLSQSTVQSNVILFLHGGNPQGVGSTPFGQIRIVNPGGAREFRSYGIIDLLQNGYNMWEPSDWKFYRYGNVTGWGGLTTTEICKQVSKTVAAPWQPSPFTVAALVLFSIFLVVYVVGFGVFVHVGKAE